jgi:hypothetical protein
MAQRKRLVLGIILLVVPLLGAVASLFAGLSSERLTLVYVSIGLSVVAVPAMVGGLVLIVLALTSRDRR